MSKCRRFSRKRGTVAAQKPDVDAVRKRVRAVGPEKFGLILVDPHKDMVTAKICDFYGECLLPPTDFANTDPDLNGLVIQIQQCMAEHGLLDMMAGVERTGRYHGPVKRALRRHWDVKMIHPFTTKQFRQPASAGIKTDPNDLAAMTAAMISGYGKDEPEAPVLYQEWRALNRMREDLVRKRSGMKAQCQEKIEAMMPGYSKLFDDLWDCQGALELARRFGAAAALKAADGERLRQQLRKRHITMLRPTIARVLAWAAQAPEGVPSWQVERRILGHYLKLIATLGRDIEQYETELLSYLVQTPAVLLLAFPGVNVVSAAGYGSELGPLPDYLNGKRITGRAGLFPSRYQSAETDRADGPIVRGHNARLRDAIMEIARNLCQHNPHFRAWAELRQTKDWSAISIQIAVGNRFVRISYPMLAGRIFFDHPSLRPRDSVLGKIIDFGLNHHLHPERLVTLAKQAAEQLPPDSLLHEIKALEQGAWRKSHSRPNPTADSRRPPHVQEVMDYLWQLVKRNQGDATTDTASS